MIQLKNVTLRRSAKVLLDAASVTLNPGEKVGLVGRNGAGKSTLFALFNGTLHEDGGDFSMPKQWRLAQVSQNMPETEESATDFVLGGDTRLAELRAILHAAELAEDGMAMAHAHVDLAYYRAELTHFVPLAKAWIYTCESLYIIILRAYNTRKRCP